MEREREMGEYERLKALKDAIVAREQARQASSIVARLVPYLQHDWLCAAREVKRGGCTCGLDVLLAELQAARKEA
jgi:hypothetical protein